MTDKTPTPTPAVVPTFGVWFRVHNPPTTLAVIVLAQIAGAYFGMVIVRAIGRDNPFPSLQDFLPLLGFIVALELVLTYWRYRRFTKARRNRVYSQTAEADAVKTTTGSGSDLPVVPVTVPAIDGKDGDSPSTGGHSPSGGKGGGGTDSPGDTGGSDGGGGGGGGGE